MGIQYFGPRKFHFHCGVPRSLPAVICAWSNKGLTPAISGLVERRVLTLNANKSIKIDKISNY